MLVPRARRISSRRDCGASVDPSRLAGERGGGAELISAEAGAETLC